MKLVAGLGNPGPRYEGTRHNVGWWLVDRLAYDWGFGSFTQEGPSLVSTGTTAGFEVTLLKPLTYMNRSGAALIPYLRVADFDPSSDLMVVVDDAALDVGKVRFRPRGSAGGHNGLKAIEGVVGSGEYARVRIGVGGAPPGADLAEWVLDEPTEEEEDVILSLLPLVRDGIETWMADGIESAMNRFNR